MITGFLQVFTDVMILAGGAGAAALAFQKYRTSREGAPRPEMKLSAEIRKVGGIAVVAVAIEIRNVGGVAIIAEARHMVASWCEILTLNCPPGTFAHDIYGQSVEVLLPPTRYLFDDEWRQGELDEDELKELTASDAKELIEPGTTETYYEIFSTDYKGLVWIHAQFCDKSNWTSHAQKLILLC